jgi:hypothetical protein
MTAIPATPAAVADPISVEPGTRPRRIAAGGSMIAAGVITLAGFLTSPWENSSAPGAEMFSMQAHPGQAMLSMVLLHYGYLLFVPFVFVAARLARRGAPKLAIAGLVLSVLGAGLSGLLVTDAYELSLAQHLTPEQALSVDNGISPSGVLAIAIPSAFGTILGLVLLTVALWRARWTSWLPAVAMFAGWVVSYGAHDMVRACTGAALTTIAFVVIGVQVLRARDEEFATGIRA